MAFQQYPHKNECRTADEFNLEEALASQRNSQDLKKNGILTPLIKQLTAASLLAEFEAPLTEEDSPNRRTAPAIAALSWKHPVTTPVPSSCN